jgi:hypothetical protein
MPPAAQEVFEAAFRIGLHPKIKGFFNKEDSSFWWGIVVKVPTSLITTGP